MEKDDRIRLNLKAERELVEELDQWRAEQGSPIPSRSEAIRKGIALLLKHKRKGVSE